MSEHELGSFAVVNTHIICFVSGDGVSFTNQEKTDVVNTTLLAQLSAHKSSKSYAHAEEWIRGFLNTASRIGWYPTMQLESQSKFSNTTHAEMKVSVDAVAARLMVQSKQVNRLKILEALLYLKGPGIPIGFEILEKHGKFGTDGAFQFVICEKSVEEGILIRVFPFAFESSEEVTSTLFQPLVDDVPCKMKYMSEGIVATLNTSLVDRIRDAIKHKLEGYVDELVAYLPI
ncbi:hypothetical protein BDN70DRAFT_885310 [Pholiota conissans]|uniref:Uncharacterized protein n=1 Tax=Pholiota conissans TaxID=109636 RepID=A0A9P5YUF7_9AGAR|nr:hypothetical protein BDN70DRAFT_885310 [Pholiota conissans]